MVKTRLQVSGGEGVRNYKALGIGGTCSVILKEEGVLVSGKHIQFTNLCHLHVRQAFWKGIGAAWMREASYTSLRLGLYGPIKHASTLIFVFVFLGSLFSLSGSDEQI